MAHNRGASSAAGLRFSVSLALLSFLPPARGSFAGVWRDMAHYRGASSPAGGRRFTYIYKLVPWCGRYGRDEARMYGNCRAHAPGGCVLLVDSPTPLPAFPLGPLVSRALAPELPPVPSGRANPASGADIKKWHRDAKVVG